MLELGHQAGDTCERAADGQGDWEYIGASEGLIESLGDGVIGFITNWIIIAIAAISSRVFSVIGGALIIAVSIEQFRRIVAKLALVIGVAGNTI